jgi:hypothetical protein
MNFFGDTTVLDEEIEKRQRNKNWKPTEKN